MRALVFLACQMPLWSVFLGYERRGWWTFYLVLWTFALTPALELIPGSLRRNRKRGHFSPLADALYGWVLVLPVATLPLLLWWCLQATERGALNQFELVGLSTSFGLATGTVGFSVAHELVHRRRRTHRFLGIFLLHIATYPHWWIEHIYGHHRGVATPGDPASARRGESLYRFLPRVVKGEFVGAWEFECRRLRRRGRSVWSLRNRVVHYAMTILCLYAAIYQGFGPTGVAFMVWQSLVAVALLEAVQYVEHYGLQRKKKSNGSWEQISKLDSWDTLRWTTNYFTFNLGRHASHHTNPRLSYQDLESLPGVPSLPSGYSTMIVLAAIPPLWFRAMDPRVDSVRQLQDSNKALN